MQTEIIAIMGEAGSGKDTVMQEVLKRRPDIHEIVSCTTRPPRDYEVEGVNYYFLSPEVFGQKVVNNEMLEATCFNDWFYGTSKDSLKPGINIGVFNPEGVESILLHKDIKTTVYWVRTTDKNRLLRQLNREADPDVHEIIRRFKADWLDFSDIDFPHYILPNNNYDDVYANAEVISASHPPQDGS